MTHATDAFRAKLQAEGPYTLRQAAHDTAGAEEHAARAHVLAREDLAATPLGKAEPGSAAAKKHNDARYALARATSKLSGARDEAAYYRARLLAHPELGDLDVQTKCRHADQHGVEGCRVTGPQGYFRSPDDPPARHWSEPGESG